MDLPRTYGVDDFPIILQDKTFDDNNQLVFAAMADTLMVNGTLAPYLEVPAQRVRLRFLNASSQRVYNLNLPPNTNPHMIGSDGGLLEAPLPLAGLSMAPGERAEFVLDFSGLNGFNMPMGSNSSGLPPGVSGGPGGPQGPPGNLLDDSDFEFLEFRVIPPTANPAGPMPMSLNTHLIWAEAAADVHRLKVFDTIPPFGFPYYINSTPFDHDMVNDTIYLDDIEVWEIRNETNVAHPFHIHDVQFYILDINGNQPPPFLAGRKDVMQVNLGDTIRFITKFENHADHHIPYMYHCHNLFHEDAGMMGQFLVLDTTHTSVNEVIESRQGGYIAYPNPTRNDLTVQLRSNGNEVGSLEIFDAFGRQIHHMTTAIATGELHLDVSDPVPGVYFIRISGLSDQEMTKRFVVQ